MNNYLHHKIEEKLRFLSNPIFLMLLQHLFPHPEKTSYFFVLSPTHIHHHHLRLQLVMTTLLVDYNLQHLQ